MLLRGSASTQTSGRGMKIASTRSRKAAINAERASRGATTKAASRTTCCPRTLGGLVGHVKGAVVHAFDREQLVVEVGQRGALARDVDQIGMPPVQQETAGRPAVRSGRTRAREPPTWPPSARVSSPVCTSCTPGSRRQAAPCGGAAPGQLRRLGGSVDLKHRRTAARLDLGGQVPDPAAPWPTTRHPPTGQVTSEATRLAR